MHSLRERFNIVIDDHINLILPTLRPEAGGVQSSRCSGARGRTGIASPRPDAPGPPTRDRTCVIELTLL